MVQIVKRHFLNFAAVGLTVIVAGCSAHQSPPLTPTDTARTPTFRSSSNSYDQPNTPFFTQPGVNPGHIVLLQSIPKHERWDQNAPLALAVYGKISSLGRSDTNYVMVQSKGNSVMVGGTVASDALKLKILEMAKTTPGVKSVISQIKIQS